MGIHRLAALKHREDQFEHDMILERAQTQPDREAMRFFETQRARIHNLIVEIEATASSANAKAPAAKAKAETRVTYADEMHATA